jgi:hypothetical protein
MVLQQVGKWEKGLMLASHFPNFSPAHLRTFKLQGRV